MHKLFALLCLLSISYTSAYYYCTCRDLNYCGHLPASCEYSSNFEQLTQPEYCHKMYGLVCIRNNMEDTTCIRQGCILPRNTTIIKEVPIFVNNTAAGLDINTTMKLLKLCTSLGREYVSKVFIDITGYTYIHSYAFCNSNYPGMPPALTINKIDPNCVSLYAKMNSENAYSGVYGIYNNTIYIVSAVFDSPRSSTSCGGVFCMKKMFLNHSNEVVYINNTIYEEVPIYIKEHTQYQDIIYYINKMNYVDNNIIIYSSYTTPLSIYENIISGEGYALTGYREIKDKEFIDMSYDGLMFS